ncbi:MAG: hypothetical protein Kow0092_09840 [Deferrisomatales bacterium]
MGRAGNGRIPVEELIEFPTRFAFKAIGVHTLVFAQAALDAVHEALGEERSVALRTRLSRKGTYMSVTLTTEVRDAEELKAAYAALRRVSGVITVL